MTRHLRLLASLVVALVPAVAFADSAPDDASAAPLVALLGQPSGACPANLQGATQAPLDLAVLSCSASALCNDGSTVSCSYGGSGTCTGIDAACPDQPGYVQCPGTTTFCPACPPSCEPQSCVQGCSASSQCSAICCGSGICTTGCNPQKPQIKYCVCLL